MNEENKNTNFPLVLTPKQAALYTGIGVDTLREISNKSNCDFVMFVKSHRRYKKDKLEEYISNIKYIE